MVKAKSKPKAKVKKAPRQKPLFKGVYIREIDTAAEYHEDCKKEFGEAGETKNHAQQALNDVMHKHKLTSYETASGIVVTVNEQSKATTKQKKEKKKDGDD